MKKIIQLFLLGISTFCILPSYADTNTKQTEALVFNCYTCHGTDGRSPGEIPKLNELSAKKIEEKLLSFRLDQSQATIMNRIAKGYTKEEIKTIADYLASVK